ncbi:PREDICTED: histone-lysine N-methyltransferase SETMAR-like [Trachymyrmex septentrionalis]|uniref:histone-lysine N-methyltransferase SETMAR-like n=1 Tax=Trachymyrmex septentrionalis TaxID=34720 RepID=UPI00084F2003|nr:PREDICTED: histone-lysine N-methyltransferase SETMAR-like [Trachymyrmex septentrionalis]
MDHFLDVCDLFLKRQENDPFLKRIITGDEKWVVYNNVKRKRSWSKKHEPAQSTSKADIHQKKLLPDNTTINSEVYCHQLDKLNDSFKQKRPELINRKGIVFHQDNARPHTSLVTRQKLLQLGWDILPHPPYSPDLMLIGLPFPDLGKLESATSYCIFHGKIESSRKITSGKVAELT